jgi:hypothetical protein
MFDLTYDGALDLAELSRDKRQRLLDHIACTNALRPADAPLAPAIAHCAALLLGDDRNQHVAVPTALALAEALCALPDIGPAVTALCDGAMALGRAELGELGISRGSLRRFLSRMIIEMNTLAQALDTEPTGDRRARVGER